MPRFESLTASEQNPVPRLLYISFACPASLAHSSLDHRSFAFSATGMLTSNDGGRCPPALARRPTVLRLPRRRRRMAVVRLGSRRGWRWRGRRLLAGLLRRLRLRCLAAKYRAALSRLRSCHAALVRDLMDGAASIEAVQSQLVMEPYFTAPFFPVTTVNCHPANYYALF
uniref:Uncharacterized protein n=1 Tax=Musa acuminata subsp. malaccensis TaxID=214687 RepID=A0A804I8X5_MUSAM